MIPKKYKWVVIAFGIAMFFDHKLKKIRGGYMTKHGKKIIGYDVIMVSRDKYENSL